MDLYTEPDFSTAALITIDTQRDTLDGQPLKIPGTSSILLNMSRLLAAFRALRRPIVHIVKLGVLFCRMHRSSLWAGRLEPRQKRPAAGDRRLDKARICGTRPTVAIPKADLTQAGTATLVVNNPGSSDSSSISFTVN